MKFLENTELEKTFKIDLQIYVYLAKLIVTYLSIYTYYTVPWI